MLDPTLDAFLDDQCRSESSTVIDSTAGGEQTNCALNNYDLAHNFHVTSIEIKCNRLDSYRSMRENIWMVCNKIQVKILSDCYP